MTLAFLAQSELALASELANFLLYLARGQFYHFFGNKLASLVLTIRITAPTTPPARTTPIAGNGNSGTTFVPVMVTS